MTQGHEAATMPELIYVASKNAGKLRDFAIAAGTMGARIEPLPHLDRIPTPAENAATFAENAAIKATYYSRALPGEIVVADDSGLEVDALAGAPGVHSARFGNDAGFATSSGLTIDQRNNLLLLERLKDVAPDHRQARYHCRLTAARDGVILFSGVGTVEGAILSAPRGSGGFGYDPLFFLPELGHTMAEIDLETKNKLSHRGKALRALLREMGFQYPDGVQ